MLRYRWINKPVLDDVKETPKGGRDWVIVKTKYAGICGSDMGLIHLHDSPMLSPYTSFPFTMGHENVGIIDEVGEEAANAGFKPGDRVVVDPCLCCCARGITPCIHCASGNHQLCLNFTEDTPGIKHGMQIGNCSISGTWTNYFLANKFQIFKIPNNVSDESAACLDSFACCLHPVFRNCPDIGNDEGKKIIIIGAGIIGLGTIAALRSLGSKANIAVVSKYKFQSEAALRFGTNEIISPSELKTKLQELYGAKIYKPMMGEDLILGGADMVFDCVGSDRSVMQSMQATRNGGNIIMVGMTAKMNLDWSLLPVQELKIHGTILAGAEENYMGERLRNYQIALKLMEKGLDFGFCLTHTFKLDDYKKAIKTTGSKTRYQLIKSAFVFD